VFCRLSRTKRIVWDDDFELIGDLYSIQLHAFVRNSAICLPNVKDVPFIPIVVRLVIELGVFEEEERGGLLCEEGDGENDLQGLIRSGLTEEHHNGEHHEPVDEVYIRFLIQLRNMGYLKKGDIQRYRQLTNDSFFGDLNFWLSGIRMRWYNPDRDGFIPLHCVACNTSILGFRLVFEAGIRYYP
jgi:hypothetical protein